jgi:plasmid stabilization system protein ParE
MVSVVWTSPALADLARLRGFLAPVNPQAAKAVFDRLKKAPRLLEGQPRLGAALSEFAPREVRRLIVDSYELRYEVTDTTIWILRLWHTREDR